MAVRTGQFFQMIERIRSCGIHLFQVAFGAGDCEMSAFKWKAGRLMIKCARLPMLRIMTSRAVRLSITNELVPVGIVMAGSTRRCQAGKEDLALVDGIDIRCMTCSTGLFQVHTLQLPSGHTMRK